MNTAKFAPNRYQKACVKYFMNAYTSTRRCSLALRAILRYSLEQKKAHE